MNDLYNLDRLVENAKNGDRDAERIINELKRYRQQRVQLSQIAIKQHIGTITTECANPVAITSMDASIPHRAKIACEKWERLCEEFHYVSGDSNEIEVAE